MLHANVRENRDVRSNSGPEPDRVRCLAFDPPLVGEHATRVDVDPDEPGPRGSGHDTLINGSIDLNGYVEIIDDQSRLTGSGFNEVIYNNLEVAGTVEDPVDTFTIDPSDIVTVNGSFDLAIIGVTM